MAPDPLEALVTNPGLVWNQTSLYQRQEKKEFTTLPHGPTRDPGSESGLLGTHHFCHNQVLSISAWTDMLNHTLMRWCGSPFLVNNESSFVLDHIQWSSFPTVHHISIFNLKIYISSLSVYLEQGWFTHLLILPPCLDIQVISAEFTMLAHILLTPQRSARSES